MHLIAIFHHWTPYVNVLNLYGIEISELLIINFCEKFSLERNNIYTSIVEIIYTYIENLHYFALMFEIIFIEKRQLAMGTTVF